MSKDKAQRGGGGNSHQRAVANAANERSAAKAILVQDKPAIKAPDNSMPKGYSDSDKLAIALALIGVAVAIALFLVEKTLLTVSVLLVVMAAVLIYPVLHFVQGRVARTVAFGSTALVVIWVGASVWSRAKLSESPVSADALNTTVGNEVRQLHEEGQQTHPTSATEQSPTQSGKLPSQSPATPAMSEEEIKELAKELAKQAPPKNHNA